MYELIEAGARTFYFDAPAKVGAYLLPDNGAACSVLTLHREAPVILQGTAQRPTQRFSRRQPLPLPSR